MDRRKEAINKVLEWVKKAQGVAGYVVKMIEDTGYSGVDTVPTHRSDWQGACLQAYAAMSFANDANTIIEAVSLLTAEPEPYNDALDYELLRLAYEEWNKQGTTEEGEAFAIKAGCYDLAIGFYGGGAYASRLVQEARGDDRRRCAILSMIYADNHGQEIVEGNLRGLYTAVLQDTEPTKAEKTMDDGRTVDQFIHDQYDDPTKVSNLNTIEVIKKLQEALAPFIGDDVDCEDPRGSAFYCDEPLECEESGKPREEWCAVCHARAVLGETEELLKELESNG